MDTFSPLKRETLGGGAWESSSGGGACCCDSFRDTLVLPWWCYPGGATLVMLLYVYSAASYEYYVKHERLGPSVDFQLRPTLPYAPSTALERIENCQALGRSKEYSPIIDGGLLLHTFGCL